ncbi:hypothetical protein HNR34_000811 [Geobacillus subterraneus]
MAVLLILWTNEREANTAGFSSSLLSLFTIQASLPRSERNNASVLPRPKAETSRWIDKNIGNIRNTVYNKRNNIPTG